MESSHFLSAKACWFSGTRNVGEDGVREISVPMLAPKGHHQKGKVAEEGLDDDVIDGKGHHGSFDTHHAVMDAMQ
jgi:hypothetical protein